MLTVMVGCSSQSQDNSQKPIDSSTPSGGEEIEKTYTVTFIDCDKKYVKTCKEGETVQAPDNQTFIKYDFECWTLQGKIYEFSTPVTTDITLTASYKANQKVDLFSPSEDSLFLDCEFGKQEYVSNENAVKLTTHHWDSDMYASYDLAKIPSDYYIYEVKIDSNSFLNLDGTKADAPALSDNKHYSSFMALIRDAKAEDDLMYGTLKYDEYIPVIAKNPLPKNGRIIIYTANQKATVYDIMSPAHSGVTYDLYYRNAHVPKGMSGLRFSQVEKVYDTIRALQRTSTGSKNYEKYINQVIDLYKALDEQQKGYVLNIDDFSALYETYYGKALDWNKI